MPRENRNNDISRFRAALQELENGSEEGVPMLNLTFTLDTPGFARSVPKELDDAATIDGAGVFRIYWQIVVPMIRPILGIVALFSFRTAWNEFITAQVFTMSNPGLKTLSVAVANLRYSSNAAAEWHIMAAGASIALIPILIVYLFANKQFIAGITAGAVKG